MPSNHLIKFVVTKDQKDMIKGKAENKGYKTISAYLRDIALNRSSIEEKFLEMYEKVMKNEGQRQD